MPLLFLFLVMVFQSFTVRADIYNRNPLPFGEKEAFLGNTGTGGARSVTAVYYNPAALADIPDSRLAVTGTSYYQVTRSSDNISTSPGAQIPFHDSTFQTVPGTLVSTFQKGYATWGYFLLVPESSEVENRTRWTVGTNQAALLMNSRATDLWGGVSGAYKLAPDLSIGATLFGINRRGTSQIIIMGEDTAQANTAATSFSSLSVSIYCLSAAVGVLYRPLDWLDIGFRFQAPFLHLSGDGTGYVSTQSTSAGVLTTSNKEEKSLDTRYSLPPDMTLGFHFTFSEFWDGYFDVSFQTPWTYQIVENSVSFSSRESVKATLRYNTGVKYKVSSNWEILSGFYWVPSGARDDSAAASLSIATTKGATLGVEWINERVRTGLGGFFVWSNSPVKEISGNDPPDEFNTRIMGALITVGYSL